ncbi:MAG: sugar transferase [Sulfurovum sp.]|nr:MAG: sugar transferase [Sulfurovum sp.]
MMQRFFDILFSSLAIALLSPVLIVASIALKITKNDILYRQKRVGLGGQYFDIYKFTTMVKNSENMGAGTITVKGDARVLPVGKFLRKSKINELPQLFNILKGDMSIIGPRPQDSIGFNAFNKKEQESIIKIRPGLSGVGSIFFRDEEEIMERAKVADKKRFYIEVISPYKGMIEAWYVEHKSLYLYFLLIFLTIHIVICSKCKIDFSKKFQAFPSSPHSLTQYL